MANTSAISRHDSDGLAVKAALTKGFTFRYPGLNEQAFILHSGGVSPVLLDTYEPLSNGNIMASLGNYARTALAGAGVEFDAIGGKWLGASLLTFAVIMPDSGEKEVDPKVRNELDLTWFGIDKDDTVSPLPGVNDRLVVTENTTTTGNEMFAAIKALEKVGRTNVTGAISIVDRSSGTVAARFQEIGVPYVSLFTIEQFQVMNSFANALRRAHPDLYTA